MSLAVLMDCSHQNSQQGDVAGAQAASRESAAATTARKCTQVLGMKCLQFQIGFSALVPSVVIPLSCQGILTMKD